MGVNQVKFGDAMVMDISDSTVTPETLLSGVTAYNKAGNKITGDVVVEHVEVEPVLETGTKSATITVGEESADIYCENTKTEVKNMKTTQSATITNGIAQFECIDKNFVKALKLTMDPIQDLHGYDHPWVGGAGKNKCPEFPFPYTAKNPFVEYTNEITFNGITLSLTFSGSFANIGAAFLIGYDKDGNATYSNAIGVLKKVSDNTNIQANTTYTNERFYFSFGSTFIIKKLVLTNYPSFATGTKFENVQLESGSTATDYAPYENICPISGRTEASVTRTGKNLFDFSNTDTTNGYVKNKWLNSNGNEMNYGNWNIGVYTRIFPNTQYTISGMTDSAQVSDGRGGYCFYDDSKTYIGGGKYNSINQVVLTPNNAKYIRVSFLSYSYSSEYPQLELGSTATSYEPYTAETHTHKYPQEILGGTDDFVNGELTNELRIISENDFAYVSSGTTPNGYHWADVNIGYTPAFNISNMLPNKNGDSGWGSRVPCFGYVTSGTYKYMRVYCTESTIEDFKTAYAGLQIVFSLETPITISTTAEKITTLPGTNVISGTEPISECAYRVLEENLSDTIYSNETLVGEDSDVYTLRTTPDISDANYVEENIVGGSVAFNQLVQNGNFVDTSEWSAQRGSISASGNILSYTVTELGGSGVQNRIDQNLTFKQNHIYYLSFSYKPQHTHDIKVYATGENLFQSTVISGTFKTFNKIIKPLQANGSILRIGFDSSSGNVAINDIDRIKEVNLTDLTLMLGSAVADYVYNLENTTAGTGIAFLQRYGFLTKDYYDYNAGSLLSVNFNKWFKTSKNLFNSNRLHHIPNYYNIIDGDDVYIAMQKNTYACLHDVGSYIPGNGRTYTLQFDPPSDITWTYASVRCRLKDNSNFGNVGTISGWTYDDATKSYRQSFENASHVEVTATIPDCLYCEFGIGYNDSLGNIKETGTYVKFSNIQLEVGSVATDYEPYEGYEISLDDSLDLRGLFRIVDNELVADGDIYEGDGKVTRKYGIVDLGDFTWVKHSTEGRFYTQFSSTDNAKPTSSTSVIGNILCLQYSASSQNNLSNGKISIDANSNPYINIIDLTKSNLTAEEFKTAMSGVILLYELAEPILNRGTNFDSPQVFIPNGNEYFVKTYTSTPNRDIDIPAGHVGKYYGKSMFKEISLPTIPKSGGTYILKCNVLADGNKKLYWCVDDN